MFLIKGKVRNLHIHCYCKLEDFIAFICDIWVGIFCSWRILRQIYLTFILVSFSVNLIKYCDKRNLRKKGLILVRSSKYSPPWWRSQGNKL